MPQAKERGRSWEGSGRLDGKDKEQRTSLNHMRSESTFQLRDSICGRFCFVRGKDLESDTGVRHARMHFRLGPGAAKAAFCKPACHLDGM